MSGTEKTSAVERGCRVDWNSFPALLYMKGQKLAWLPNLDLTRDCRDWEQLAAPDRTTIASVISTFLAGDSAVTLHLPPMLLAIAQEQRMDEVVYLSQFLYEESKHVQALDVYIAAVCPDIASDTLAVGASDYLFFEELKKTMARLCLDHSPPAVIEAVVTYNMIVEGVVAKTAFEVVARMLAVRSLFPGLLRTIQYIHADEARHIAFGIYLLGRLIGNDDHLYSLAKTKMQALFRPAVKVFSDFRLPPANPFEITTRMIFEIAGQNLSDRLRSIEHARRHSSDEISVAAGSDVLT